MTGNGNANHAPWPAKDKREALVPKHFNVGPIFGIVSAVNLGLALILCCQLIAEWAYAWPETIALACHPS